MLARSITTGIAALISLFALSCEGPEPLVVEETLSTLVDVSGCRHSHEHDLRHVRIVADPVAAMIYEECVLGEDCSALAFPVGSLFVKYEYDQPECVASDLLGYTASLRLEDGSYDTGRDWHWQRLDETFDVLEDGAPRRCLLCHTDHCSPPDGFDLRCTPD